MSVHIRQSVREQPDTGYWKCPGADFAADRLNWFWGIFCGWFGRFKGNMVIWAIFPI